MPSAYHTFREITPAQMVKCFNTTGFENMQNPLYGDVALYVYMADDHKEANTVVRQMAKDIGFEERYGYCGTDKVVVICFRFTTASTAKAPIQYSVSG